MLAQRLSQQTTQQTSFLNDKTQYTPADVPVPDITPDARTSNISYHRCNHSDIKMCPCALPLASAPASVSQAPACLPVPAHLLRLLREMSARPDEQCAHLTSSIASMRASLKDKSPISSLSLPALPSGCRSCQRGPLRLTRHLPTFAKRLPPYKPHQCPLSRPQEQVPSGPCPMSAGVSSLCVLRRGRPRPSHELRHKQTFFSSS